MNTIPLESVFSMASNVAVFAWLVLAIAPARVTLTRPLVVAIAVMLAMCYAALFASFAGKGGGGFGSLDGIAQLFSNRGVLLAGWVHYLAFDLLVGLWEREEAHRIGLSRLLLVPCLFLTLMLGPLGWLCFMALRLYKLNARKATVAP